MRLAFRFWSRAAVLLVPVLFASAARGDGMYQQTNLISSATDPDLVNPWGISASASSPFWVSDNATGKSTLYNSAGVKQGLVVSMPAGSEPITGQVFNSSTNFNGDLFLFASENGTIAGWRGALGTNAELLQTVTAAVYKGLAISTAQDTLYAANFHSGAIDVFDSTHTGPTGSFFDPNLPAGYAPFNIQNLGGKLYVTFALQDADKHDDVAGPGNGFVDVFDPVTHAFSRLVSNGALNSPWGVAIAPSTFGQYANALLVGNFGDGKINAFDPNSGTLLGTLKDGNGNPLVNPGLWGLQFGNGGRGGDLGVLYFTAGGADESSGLFGSIRPVPEPASLVQVGLGAMALLALGRRMRRRR